MTAPISAHVGKVFESMRDAMVEFGLIWIGLGVRLRDTLGDHLWVTLLVASVIAVRTLHAGSVLEELTTESATHDVIELLLHEFVAILFDNFFFALANSAFATKSDVEWCLITRVLGCCLVSTERSLHIAANLPKDMER
jgi:hypothetical protein